MIHVLNDRIFLLQRYHGIAKRVKRYLQMAICIVN